MKLNGPGKYDDACTLAKFMTSGEAVVLIVFDGHLGSGFEVQTTSKQTITDIPSMLEQLAKDIRDGTKLD